MRHDDKTAYYKRKYHKGKSFFARIVDYLFIRLIAGVAFFFWFASILSNTIVVIVLTAAALGVFCVLAALYTSICFDIFVKKERRRVSDKLYNERLAILDKTGFSQIVRKYIEKNPIEINNTLICVSQQTAKLTENQMLRICRKAHAAELNKAIVFCISGSTVEARELSERYRISTVFICADALKPFAYEILPDDGDIDKAVIDYEQSWQKRKVTVSSPLNPIRAKRYWLIALVLFVASLFVRYAIYYRILGGVCICFAMIAQQFHYEKREL